MKTLTVKQLADSLREGQYTSLGCYPKFYVTADDGVLSHNAVMANFARIGRACRDFAEYNGREQRQWAIVAVEINWEDPYLFCDHTYERIPSAYAEE